MIAFAIFAVQMTFALQKYMANPLMSSPNTKTLSKFEKPLQITVCKTNQFNYSAAEDLGYTYAKHFFTGELFRNKSMLSWTGIQDKFTFNETFSYLYNSSLENIESFRKTSNGSITNFNRVASDITNKVFISKGICKIFSGIPGESMEIRVKGTGEKYDVTLSDPEAGVSFLASAQNMFGDKISIETQPQTLKIFTKYLIQLKETHLVSSKGLCVDYPNSKYNRYADCVDDELEKKILPVLGCMIPQLSTKKQCTSPIPRLLKHDNFLKWLRFVFMSEKTGRQYKSDSCPLPCSTVSVQVRFQEKE